MYPDQFIYELIRQADIVKIMGLFLDLERSDDLFISRCPFCGCEKLSAFLIVDPVRQYFDCADCGRQGSVLGFLMLYLDYDFVETVQLLAEFVGVRVQYAGEY